MSVQADQNFHWPHISNGTLLCAVVHILISLSYKAITIKDLLFEPTQSIFYKVACAPSEDSDQPANPCSMINFRRVFCGHYENMPFQIYLKFYHQKIENCQIKILIFFHISAQNIDCGYSLEPPRRGGSK